MAQALNLLYEVLVQIQCGQGCEIPQVAYYYDVCGGKKQSLTYLNPKHPLV